MGQYYRIVLKNRRDGLVLNDRKYVGGDYVMAKLMEHSYLGNFMTSAVAYAIEGMPSRVMWVGDYAEKSEIRELTNRHLSLDRIWGDDHDHEFPNKGKFDYVGKLLVNHTKKLCLPYDEYVEKVGKDKFGFTIDPLPLLTAVGNGRGGGDYHSHNGFDKVGTWAWDRIEIVSGKPKGYNKFVPKFREE